MHILIKRDILEHLILARDIFWCHEISKYGDALIQSQKTDKLISISKSDYEVHEWDTD